MGRPALLCADLRTDWLADLIEATEAVAALADVCDVEIIKAFGHRLEMRADIRPPFDPEHTGA